jgi:hypothetical protein
MELCQLIVGFSRENKMITDFTESDLKAKVKAGAWEDLEKIYRSPSIFQDVKRANCCQKLHQNRFIPADNAAIERAERLVAVNISVSELYYHTAILLEDSTLFKDAIQRDSSCVIELLDKEALNFLKNKPWLSSFLNEMINEICLEYTVHTKRRLKIKPADTDDTETPKIPLTPFRAMQAQPVKDAAQTDNTPRSTKKTCCRIM